MRVIKQICAFIAHVLDCQCDLCDARESTGAKLHSDGIGLIACEECLGLIPEKPEEKSPHIVVIIVEK